MAANNESLKGCHFVLVVLCTSCLSFQTVEAFIECHDIALLMNTVTSPWHGHSCAALMSKEMGELNMQRMRRLVASLIAWLSLQQAPQTLLLARVHLRPTLP